MSGWRGKLITRSPLRVFLFFLASTIAIALFFQLILLPYILPSLHLGRGIMLGHDSVAIEEAISRRYITEMYELGLKVFIPYPSSDYYFRLIAFCYAYIVPMPWIMIPLHALCYSLGALFLFLILNRFTANKNLAFVATLPLILLPSSWSLFTQLQRDPFVVMGAMGFLWAFLNLMQSCMEKTKARLLDCAVLFISVYTLLVFRTYVVYLIKPLVITAFFLNFVPIAVKFSKQSVKIAAYNFICLSVLTGSILNLKPGEINITTTNDKQIDKEVASTAAYVPFLEWQSTSWIPTFLDQKAKLLIRVRQGAVQQSTFGTFNVDLDVKFHQLSDMVMYLPRALQLSLFSPFPRDWINQSVSIFRKIAGIETLLGYVLFFFATLYFFQQKSPYLFTLFIICLYISVTYPYALVNVGTMYRLNLIWHIPLFATGIIGLLSFLPAKSKLARYRKNTLMETI